MSIRSRWFIFESRTQHASGCVGKTERLLRYVCPCSWQDLSWSLALVLLILIPLTAISDEIVLGDGRVIEATVVEESETKVRIKVSAGSVISLPRSRIASITKSDAKDDFEAEVQSLIGKKQFAKAYSILLSDEFAATDNRQALLSEVVTQLDAQISAEIQGKTATELERRRKSHSLTLPTITEDSERFICSRKLAHVLLALADSDMDMVRKEDAKQKFQMAFNLAPDMQGLAPTLVESMRNRRGWKGEGYSILRDYLAVYQDEVEVIELALECDWSSDPWFMLNVVYPKATPHSDATKTIHRAIPDVLLACFNLGTCPANAPFDRIECYEHLMEIEPATDPSPWVVLKIQGDHALAYPITRWAKWSEQQGHLLAAALAFDAAESQVYESGKKPSYKEKISDLNKRQQTEWQKELAAHLSRHDYANGHNVALKILAVHPGQSETATAVREMTAIRDACRLCKEGRVTCRDCGGDGAVTKYRSCECYICEGVGRCLLKVGGRIFECPDCDGTGLSFNQRGYLDAQEAEMGVGGFSMITITKRMCPGCDGLGEVRIGGTLTLISCPRCTGSGEIQIPYEGRCDKCQGKGKVTCPRCRGALYTQRQSPRPPTMRWTSLSGMPKWLVQMSSDSERFGHLNGTLKSIAQLRDITVTVPDYPQSVARTATSKVRQPRVLKNVDSPYNY